MSRVIIAITSELALLFITISLLLPGSIAQPSLAQHPPTAANTTTSATTNTNFQTYSNSSFGIKVKYPSNWFMAQLSRSDSSVPVVKLIPPGKVPIFLLLTKNVNYVKNIKDLKLANLTLARENQLTHADPHIFHLVSSIPATLAGNPAHKIEFTQLTPQGKYELMQLISLVGKAAYWITYGAPLANYTTYLPTAQKIIDSAQVIK
jgi:hypothetical protein